MNRGMDEKRAMIKMSWERGIGDNEWLKHNTVTDTFI
jgi:hypothetical protein